jgi:hypothetical protein
MARGQAEQPPGDRGQSVPATRAAATIARPGIVSIVTAGDLLQSHPHLHLITTEGGRAPEGTWHLLPQWDSVGR